ncbi:mitochondrial intermediate peptidase [Cylas formicarius]|uniref:mitochondrial intermediate peptidase n=1 Tax=Cylas formicarius TaxID=197179 RepID=UPI0029587C30|nr:mitochondrial intermediate peptidase [Cylas formicarius]
MFPLKTIKPHCGILHFAKSNVSIWSPLAEAFNSRPLQKVDTKQDDVGLFGIEELKSPAGFGSLKYKCLQKTDNLMNEATQHGLRSRKMVEIFDDISDSLCQVADLAEFVRLSHPNQQFNEAAQVACATVSGIVEKLNTNVELYNILKSSIRKGDVLELTEVDKLVGELFLFDFEQCGIHLSEIARNEVVWLNDDILNLSQQFVAGTSTSRTVHRNILPTNVRDIFVGDQEKIIISGLYTHSSNPIVREMAYKIYLHQDPRQENLLSKLLHARYKLARICGFSTYSERALKGGIMDSSANVMNFLDDLNLKIWDKAQLDFECMDKIKQKESPNYGMLSAWDVPYYTYLAKNDWFKISGKEYSPYFSLGTCMDGLNMIFQSLFGISLVNSHISPGECWYPDVYKLAVEHESEGLLGYIYCDFYERSGKPNQDCHFTIRGGKQLPDGSYQLPIVVLMLNLPPPRWSSPSLLTPNLVDNLFHEMGHAMHSMLGRTQYQHVTGTRCSTDFAEVPSILMEHFSSDRRVLQCFAKHFQTHQPLTDDMLERLCTSKRLFVASETQLQIFYSALDQVYHAEHSFKQSTTNVLAETQPKYYGLPYVPNTAWQLRFSHLAGYGAKYYSYLASRAVASLIWKTYFDGDPFSRSNGERYRRECLALGGGKNPKELVGDFLKVDPTPFAFSKALVEEIEDCQSQVDRFLKR